MSARERLVAELRRHGLVIGEVTLTSGAKAQYLIDAKRAILRPADGIAMIKLSMQFNAARKTLKKIRGPVLDASQLYLDCLSLDAATPARA